MSDNPKRKREGMSTTDSRVDTYRHIHNVQCYLLVAIADLQLRLMEHDASKLVSPEKEAYDGLNERLRGHEYGSEGYRAVLREVKPAIKHHMEHNAHHPEFHEQGISGMSLLDLIEMLCDWKAASLRHPDGGVVKYMDHNQERFGFSDELKAILLNTAYALGLDVKP